MDSKAMTFITHQAIFSAVRCGDLEGLKEQLRTSEGVISEVMSMQNDAGETLLYMAAEIGHREVFSFLLGLCDLEVLKIRANSDMNAFHVAAKRGHLGRFFLLCFFWFFSFVFYFSGLELGVCHFLELVMDFAVEGLLNQFTINPF